MLLTIHSIGASSPVQAIDAAGKSLGELLKAGRLPEITRCRYNGNFIDDWPEVKPQQGDRVEIFAAVKYFPGLYEGIIQAIISAVISTALNFIVKALTPKPKKPKFDGASKQVFGIAGLTNTTGKGTPKFVVYGENEVAGAIISSRVRVKGDGSGMESDVLYFMGDTAGDGYQSIGAEGRVKINGVSLDNFPGTTIITRTGEDNQAIIPEFANISQVFTVGTQLPMNERIVYRTRGTQINEVTLQISFSSGLFIQLENGKRYPGRFNAKLEIKPAAEPSTAFVEVGEVALSAYVQQQWFGAKIIKFPSAGEWDIGVTMFNHDNLGGFPTIFNVQELQYTSTNYGGNALMAVLNISSSQVQSIDGMRCTAIVEGKKVKHPSNNFSAPIYTQERVWIGRDFLTNPRLGLGMRVDESEHDDAGSQLAQDYYNELVLGRAGDEVRDLCDVIYAGDRGKWDFLRDVICGEARGRYLTSGGKFRHAVKKPETPNLLYAEPGNIIEGSLKSEYSAPDPEFNQWLGEFLDRDKNFTRQVYDWPNTNDISGPIAADSFHFDSIKRESEVHREIVILGKEAQLVKRRWKFGSPLGRMVSEPLDVDKQALKRFAALGAVSGFCKPESTTARLYLDRMVTLESGKSYRVEVQHVANNAVESRLIATAAGEHGYIEPAAPFSVAPAEDDIYAIGIDAQEIVPVRIEAIEMDENGDHSVTVSEYIPAVYTLEDLPTPTQLRFFAFAALPPLPLRAASASEENVQNPDGVRESVILFDVTVEPPFHAGVARGGGPDEIELAHEEPSVPGLFQGAYCDIQEGAGVGQSRLIKSYTVGSRKLAKTEPWDISPDGTSRYLIRFPLYGNFYGFKVERSDSVLGPWVELGRFVGTHGEISGRGQSGTDWLRFTSQSYDAKENLLGRPVLSLSSVGDGNGPADVTNFNIIQFGDRLIGSMDAILDLDFDHFELREGMSWEGGGVILGNLTQNYFELSLFPIGQHSFWIKAIDRSGNASVNAATVMITVEAPTNREEFLRVDEIATLGGTLANVAVRSIEGNLYLGLTTIDKWDVVGLSWDAVGKYWDRGTVLTGTYTTPIYNLPALALCRAYLDIGFANFAGGFFTLEARYSTNGGSSFTPWRPLTTGDLRMNAVQLRLNIFASTPSSDPLVMKVCTVVDSPQKTVHYPDQAVPGTGLTINYSTPYLRVPTVQVTSATAGLHGERAASGRTGVTVFLKDSAGAAQAGFADVTVVGI